MSLTFALGDAVANFLLTWMLPKRISDRVRENLITTDVYVLHSGTKKCSNNNTSNNNDDDDDAQNQRMTLFEAVFATILFDLALFGTNNIFINGIISLFTSIQNSWDTPYKSKQEAKRSILEFCKRLGIQTSPWIWDKPIEDYASLNDFFSRTYASFPPIAISARLVSPACCKLLSYNDDSTMKNILIKGCDYDISKIGLPSNDIDKYKSNRVLLGYLSPKDYHRVHSPISGRVIHCQMEGVDALSASVKFFNGKFNLLNENKRLVVVIEEEEYNNDNTNDDSEPLRVGLVIIGGVGVNTIVHHQLTGRSIVKGDEIGMFRAGGSAIALFTTKPLNYIQHLSSDLHVEALVGEALAYDDK